MSKIVDFPSKTDKTVTMKGPELTGHSVIVDGRVIPRLRMHDLGDNIELVLDNRFGITIPRDYAYQVAWGLANALAIGEGYPFLGAESKDRPFAPECFEITLDGDGK